ncbi:membrane protein insertase YidC [Staphylococcus gallinarum]|uniref:Membrane protein insertase YidC n=1 Tax=Staphylococcus gallinarum TaxID=1293 RepID=A0A3A0VW27_STAGA|nr:membrane protein insertase YidC [Staphylococcus gallinarum]RIP37309.1 membrane protein insertase YidC [Staphylococcus gallinarum]
MQLRWFSLLFILIVLTSCDNTHDEQHQSLFNILFVKPIDWLLHSLGHVYGEMYGLAIITIVIIIRLLLLPFMVLQVRNMHMMREKTRIVKPQIDELKQHIKEAKTQEERLEHHQALVNLYKKYAINPYKNMIGCLPILIQLPILYGLIITLKYPSSNGIDSYPHFLWFDLTEPNLWISLIAATVYFIQPLVNSIHYPKEQRTSYYVLMVLSPIFITYISLHSASALGLYWTVGGIFLIIQMHFAHKYYRQKAQSVAQTLQSSLNQSHSYD